MTSSALPPNLIIINLIGETVCVVDRVTLDCVVNWLDIHDPLVDDLTDWAIACPELEGIYWVKYQDLVEMKKERLYDDAFVVKRFGAIV